MAPKNISIQDLVQGFAAHLKELHAAETNEASLRQNYIDPFWRALGWDVGDTVQLGPAESDVIVEKNVQTVDANGLRNRRPDYLFRIGGFPRFIVEAKKPTLDLDDDKDAIFQAKQYAWNSTIPFAVLTDFGHFRLYDATLKPIYQEPGRGIIKEFAINFEDYENQWDLLHATFGRAAVAEGSLENLLARVKKLKRGRRVRAADRTLVDLKGSEPVDQVFLAYLDVHRRHLASDIYHRNIESFPEADTLRGAAKLTEAVQRVMDRLVFMRVCEDRGIMPFGDLHKTLDRVGVEGGNLYGSLAAAFRDLDEKYNGYLYKPHFSEQLTVDAEVLSDFIRTLYPPDGPWDFAAIGDDILGIVYERYLGNVVAVKSNEAVVEEKPEVRHAGGVYYTPRFVVDTIVRRVLGPQLKGRTPAQVLDVKILDPACGSGSFLVVALQYLFDYCLAEVRRNPALARAAHGKPPARGAAGAASKTPIAFKDKQGEWSLAPDFRSALLTHCIYGVDIDQQAAEVTVMSLYLKMLEAKLPDNWATLWVERQLLPPLDNNIRCGNSLIDDEDYYAFREKTFQNQPSLYEDESRDTAFRINRFVWTSRSRGFGRLLDDDAVRERGHGGFDCIIGNPPYIRVQELNKWAPEECEYYKWRYKSAAKGNYDIYVVFTEKALSLLAPGGLLGFIMPHKFWQAQYGEGLRGIIAEGGHLRSIVDFGHHTVFSGASIYTAIHVFSHSPSRLNGVTVAKINKLTDASSQMAALERRAAPEGVETFRASRPTGAGAWTMLPPSRVASLAALREASGTRLSDIAARMAQGVRTSMNSVYVLTRIGKSQRFLSEYLGREVELEREFLLEFLGGRDMRRYEIRPASRVLIAPYQSVRGQSPVLADAGYLAQRFPATWAYLKACEKALRGREDGKMDSLQWYGYVYPKNLEVMKRQKIMVPDIIEQPAFSLDERGAFAFVSGYAVVLRPKFAHHTRLVLAILNSRIAGNFLRSISTALRGGWYRPFPQFIGQIPIKLPGTTEEKKLADAIVHSVGRIIAAKTALQGPMLSDREINQFGSEVEAHEQRINELVLRLYNVEAIPD